MEKTKEKGTFNTFNLNGLNTCVQLTCGESLGSGFHATPTPILKIPPSQICNIFKSLNRLTYKGNALLGLFVILLCFSVLLLRL